MKKLALERETVIALTLEDLTDVNGGFVIPTTTTGRTRPFSVCNCPSVAACPPTTSRMISLCASCDI